MKVAINEEAADHRAAKTSIQFYKLYPPINTEFSNTEPKRKCDILIGPSDGVIGTCTKPGGVIMEAAVKDGAAVHELPAQHIRACVVQPHALINHHKIPKRRRTDQTTYTTKWIST